MNTFGEWYNPLTWFDDSGTTPEFSTGGTGSTGTSNDLFGFNFDNFFGHPKQIFYQKTGYQH